MNQKRFTTKEPRSVSRPRLTGPPHALCYSYGGCGDSSACCHRRSDVADSRSQHPAPGRQTNPSAHHTCPLPGPAKHSACCSAGRQRRPHGPQRGVGGGCTLKSARGA